MKYQELIEYALAQKVEAYKYQVLFERTQEGYGVSDLPCGFNFAADFFRVLKAMGFEIGEKPQKAEASK